MAAVPVILVRRHQSRHLGLPLVVAVVLAILGRRLPVRRLVSLLDLHMAAAAGMLVALQARPLQLALLALVGFARFLLGRAFAVPFPAFRLLLGLRLFTVALRPDS
jgi:hypothetical protein